MQTLIKLIIFLFSSVSLASPITYVCNYGSYSDEEGNHKAEKEFRLTFILDTENEKAYIVGNQGSEEVAVFPHRLGGISFVEVTSAGNVMATAIDTANNSVHSRNTSLGGELVPSQYYGKCVIK